MSKGKQQAQEFKEKGNTAFTANKFVESITWYNKAIEADSTDHVLYSNRSAAYAGSRDFAKALADADQCIKIKSDWPKGYFRKSTALIGLNRASEAVEILNAGLKHDKGNAELLKKLEEARGLLKKEDGKGPAKKSDAKPTGKVTGIAAKEEGNEHFKNSRYEAAITSYTVAVATIEDTNEKAVIYSNKAACYLQLRSYDEVVSSATEAITLVPTHTKSLLRRGLAYESLEKGKLAKIDLQQVIELEPGTALANTASQALHRIKAAHAHFESGPKK